MWNRSLVAAIFLLPSSAFAQSTEPPPEPAHRAPAVFGGAGQLAISSDANVALQSRSTDGFSAVTSVVLGPAADYFVAKGFSLGGQLLFGYSAGGEAHATTLGVAPRVGYNVTFSPLVSLWLRAGFAFTSTTATLAVGPIATDATETASKLTLQFFSPFLVHPAPHFFLGLGPSVSTDVSASHTAKVTAFGLAFIVGGWFLGD